MRLVLFLNDTTTTEIYTLSLHDALPIWPPGHRPVPEMARRLREVSVLFVVGACRGGRQPLRLVLYLRDRKSTRLNSSHSQISYAVFCLKKKRLLTFIFCFFFITFHLFLQ